MISWNQLPLLRILVPFIAGILTALCFNFGVSIEIILSLFILILILSLYYTKLVPEYRQRWVFGAMLTVLVFFCGIIITNNKFASNQLSVSMHSGNKADTVMATIIDPVNEKQNTFSTTICINAFKQNEKWNRAGENAIVYFQKDSLANNIRYGDKLIITTSFADVSPPQNPGEFDYKHYLTLKSVYKQAYIKSGKWTVLSHNDGNFIKSFALRIRKHFLKIFESNGISGEEYAVAGAVILGYRDKIDADLYSVYQGAGVMHLLCVAGMHVGIVFIVLSFLLSFLDKSKKGKYFKPIILILFIWFYAVITGLSPPVNRAALMITFVIIGKMLGRYTNVYNTLSASALIMLIFDPALIADTGFQLSYVAVLGISLLYPAINKLWITSHRILKYIWQIASVSIAAQLSIFPLAMLYFHQFPNYFLIANILVVPLASIIIYCGMFVLLVSPFNLLVGFAAKVLVYLIYMLNSSIRYIESMPFSNIKAIHITAFEMFVIYASLLTAGIFISSKRSLYLKLTFVFAIVLAVVISVNKLTSDRQKKLIVYDINKSSALDIISGSEHILLSDSVLINDTKAVSMHIQNNWINIHLNDATFIDMKNLNRNSFRFDNNFVYVKNNLLQFFDKRMAIVNESNCYEKSDYPLNVDYLLVTGNIKSGIAELLNTYKPAMIIFDSSNSSWKTEKWINECSDLNIPYYSVQQSGAFELSL
ncbi:MAG: ComEC/Rec2 family competence protein [Bacteroidales bacterium]|jgi:competence protein ComEC